MSDGRGTKRRLASGRACIGCRNRKHRCDGARPVCGSCQSRSETCQYPVKVTGLTTVEALSPRSGSRTRVIQGDSQFQQPHAQQHEASMSTPKFHSAKERLDPWRSSSDILRRSDENISSGVVPHPTTIARFSVAGEVEKGESSACPPVESGGPDGFFGRSSNFAFISEVSPHHQHDHGVHLQNKQHAVQSRSQGVQSPTIPIQDSAKSSSHYILPDKTLANNLVDAYFDRVHPLYPFVHEGTFRSEYEKIWGKPINSSIPASWYAVLNMIFASSCEFCDAIPEIELMQTVAPFVARSRDIIFSYVFNSSNLELVQALLLMCHYLQGTMELNECWTLAGLMIRSAITIGLHLSPEKLSLTIVEKEVRKRVWWGCFILDRTLSWKFGRPVSIQASNIVEVPLPLPIDDQYFHNDSTSSRQPVGRPPILAFFLHTIKLAHIIDQILQALYTTNKEKSQQSGTDTPSQLGSSSSHVLGQAVILDSQLQVWWNERPVHLHPRSGTVEGRIFERQQTVMQLRYLQIRILLQRHLLLVFSRNDIDDHFLRAIAIAGSQTCISAAKDTIRLVYKQYRRNLLNSLRYNLHYIFTSMGVLLHLYSMNKSKLELLGYEQEDEIFEWGMEFIVAASTTSTLAARYATMLQGARPTVVNSSFPSSRGDGEDLLPMSSGAGDLAMPQPSAASGTQPWRFNGPRNANGEIDMDGMNFDDWDGMNFDDLLFGTGLPHDIMSFSYPFDGYAYNMC